MMFQWLGERHEDAEISAIGDKIQRATEAVLSEGRFGTSNLGGRSTTGEVGDAMAEKATLISEPF
jgi:isocitrate/isopropylmalate dehydrogenase